LVSEDKTHAAQSPSSSVALDGSFFISLNASDEDECSGCASPDQWL